MGLSTEDPFSQLGGSNQARTSHINAQTGPSNTSTGHAVEEEDLVPDELIGYRFERPEDPGRRMRAALEGIVEDLTDQEDRVYSAEVRR